MQKYLFIARQIYQMTNASNDKFITWQIHLMTNSWYDKFLKWHAFKVFNSCWWISLRLSWRMRSCRGCQNSIQKIPEAVNLCASDYLQPNILFSSSLLPAFVLPPSSPPSSRLPPFSSFTSPSFLLSSAYLPPSSHLPPPSFLPLSFIFSFIKDRKSVV